jgi:hypothetical protein
MSRGLTIKVEGTEEAIRALVRTEAKGRQAAAQAVNWTLFAGVSQMKKLLSQPGEGRLYTRGTVQHRASKPGDPPAVDTGRYRASWRHRMDADGMSGELFTEVEYGPHLEYGTRRMAARPHASLIAERMRVDFPRHTVAALKRLEGK